VAELHRRVDEAMTRDTLQRRLRVAGPLAAVLAVVGVTAWLGPKSRDRKSVVPPDGDASLLVFVFHIGQGEPAGRHRLLRVPFKGNEPQPAEVVWEGTRPFLHHPANRIIDDRYLVTATGCVIDIREKQQIYEGSPEPIDANSDRVVFGIHTSRAREFLVAFDLKTRKERKLTGPEAESFSLPGVCAPDGAKSVSSRGCALVLHRVGQPQRELGEFWVQQGRHSSDSGTPPVLWLDNERFLTQHGNGNLIAVALDGTRTPVAQVPARTEISSSPRLDRDAAGHIAYMCGSEVFLIDVDAKTGERWEWGSLGHGFEANWNADRRGRFALRYEEREIGELRSHPHYSGRAACTTGRIAVVGDGKRVRVWSAGTGVWTELDLRSDTLIGWLK
jgi:hypothetical protein